MKKSEKLLAAIVTMVLGVLLIFLKGKCIALMMSVAGLSLIVLGVIDICNRCVPPAVIKCVVGVLIIICGWLTLSAVLYVLSALLLIAGFLLLYDKIKKRPVYVNKCLTWLEYAKPSLCIAIGFLFLFHTKKIVGVILITSGIFTLLIGGILLFFALNDD